MYKLFTIFLLLSFTIFQSQTLKEKCNIKKTFFEELYRVDDKDVRCLAKNSSNKNTIFLSFARWCLPCLYHLDDFINLKEKYDVDLYVLLVDKENSKMTLLAKDYVNERFPGNKIAIINDIDGRGRSKKYKEFLGNITPKKFEIIEDMSKFFVLNQEGEVLLVTSWKDSEKDPDWKDSKPMIERLIIPLLEKK